MNTLTLKIAETDLASRAKAALLREKVLTILSSGSNVDMDLANVESISDSFADELFGVLAASYGIESLAQRLRVSQATDSLYKVIALNINNRLHQVAASA